MRASVVDFYNLFLDMQMQQMKEAAAVFDHKHNADSVEQLVERCIKKMNVHDELLKARLRSEILRMGPLESLIQDPEVTEILVNSWQHVHYEKLGALHTCEDFFASEQSYEQFIERLSRICQTFMNREKPFIECQFENLRITVIFRDLSRGHHLVSLRKKRDVHIPLRNLAETGWCNANQAEAIRQMISDRKNFLVIGGTGSGKTTVLQTLLFEMSKNERVVIIEDTQELNPASHLSVSLLTQTNILEPQQNVTMDDLLKRALRLRPDRIGVGEIRGPEAKTLLMALSTGHEGSFGSLHARDAHEALMRLEMLIQMGAPQWSVVSIRRLIGITIDCILVVEKKNGARRLQSIHQVASVEDIGITLNQIA